MTTAYTPAAKLVEATHGAIRPDDVIVFKLEDKINENHNPYMIEAWVFRNGQLLSAGYRNSPHPDAYCGEEVEFDFDLHPMVTSAERLTVLEEKDRSSRPRCSKTVDYYASGTRVHKQCVRPATGSNGHCKHHTPK